MYKDRWKRRKEKIWGRGLSLALTACLLAAVLTGCGDKKEEESILEDVSDSVVMQESDEKEKTMDAAALVQWLEEGMEGAGNISLSRRAELAGKAVIEGGTYPVKIYITYDTEINGEDSEDNVSISLRRDDDGGYESNYYSDAMRVLSEGGQPVTYVCGNDSNWMSAEGDGLKAEQKIKELLGCFGDTGLSMLDNGYESYSLEAELSGESLRKILAEYGGFTAEELEYPGDLSAQIKMDAYSYDKNYNMNLTITCDELSRTILSQAYGVEFEEGTFSLNVMFSSSREKSEYFSAEKPKEAAQGDGERAQAPSVSAMLSQLMDEIYAKGLEEGFQEIEETTDPVVLQARGMAVTVAIPQGVREEGTLALRKPNRARLELRNWETVGNYRMSHGALWADFELGSDSPEALLAEGREDYLSCEDKSHYRNLEFRDSRTVDVEMGQAQVISFSYDDYYYEDDPDHRIKYYAALPLENGKVLSVKIESAGDVGDESNVCDDDTLRTILNHCAVGSEAPQVSDSGDTGSQSGNVRFATVEELLQDPTFGSNFYDAAEAMASSSGLEVTVRADGENVVFTMTLNPPPAGSAYDIEGLKTSFDKNFSSEEMVQVTGILAALLKEYAAVEDPKVIWEIYTDKGEEILTKEYSPVEGGSFSIE